MLLRYYSCFSFAAIFKFRSTLKSVLYNETEVIISDLTRLVEGKAHIKVQFSGILSDISCFVENMCDVLRVTMLIIFFNASLLGADREKKRKISGF